jgi:hypothetical protein
MKMKIRSDDVSMHQMDDWLAELREGDWAEPDDGRAASARGDVRPAAPAEAPGRTVSPVRFPSPFPTPPLRAASPAPASPVPASVPSVLPTWRVAAAAPAAPAEAVIPVEAAPHPGAAPHPEAEAHPQAAPHPGPQPDPDPDPTVRALIGNQLRMPVMWCEMGSCISSHADPAALGEADMRVRAIAAGWRIDAFGRLACPQCQQNDPGFRTSSAVVPWDRYTAMARTARIVGWRPASLRRRPGSRCA